MDDRERPVPGGEQVSVARMALNETEDGRRIAARFIELFGTFVSEEVRPVLRRVAEEGGEPQLLVNGLAELLRQVAEATEQPIEG